MICILCRKILGRGFDMRRKKLFLGILVLCIIVMTGTGILLAAPNINLSIGTNQNTCAGFLWWHDFSADISSSLR